MAANAKLGSSLTDIKVTLGCFLGETKLRNHFGRDLKQFNSVERDHRESGKENFTVNWRL